MPEYHLDTHDANDTWSTLDAFTQGYIEAMFFTEEERLCEESEGERNMPDVGINKATMQSHFVGGNSFGFADLASDSLARIVEDCRKFQEINEALLNAAYDDWNGTAYDEQRAGNDFWYTRCGHGIGFWSSGLGDIGDKLSEACGFRTAFPNRDVYLGDDNKVHVS